MARPAVDHQLVKNHHQRFNPRGGVRGTGEGHQPARAQRLEPAGPADRVVTSAEIFLVKGMMTGGAMSASGFFVSDNQLFE